MPEPIVDWYGREIEVEGLMGSPGPVVDVELSGGGCESSYLRLLPDQALDLADRLKQAAEVRP